VKDIYIARLSFLLNSRVVPDWLHGASAGLPQGVEVANEMSRLTKRTVDAAAPDGRDRFVWDDEMPGFGLRVFESGKKSYLIQYKLGGRGGRTRRMTLGLHGKLTPDEARRKAATLLAVVTNGGDPAADRAEVKKAITVAELAELYYTEGPADKPNKKASSWQSDRSNIERHIKPLLGRRLIQSLTSPDIARFQADVASGKSKADLKTGNRGRAIVKGGKGTAARSLAVLGAMLQFAVARQLISTNPAKGVKLFKGELKERFLTDTEVGSLADALTTMERERTLPPTAATAVRLLMLTGCRKNEILSLRWEWVDHERSCIRLPDSKTGAKVVPLGVAALQLLNGLPQTADTWVLPAARGRGHYTGLQKDWKRIRTRAGLLGLRLHDLRHSFASFAVADGHTLFMIGKVLGHKQSRTTEGYAHLASDPLRVVADRTSDKIAAAMKGAAAKTEVNSASAND
jgi:integrase